MEKGTKEAFSTLAVLLGCHINDPLYILRCTIDRIKQLEDLVKVIKNHEDVPVTKIKSEFPEPSLSHDYSFNTFSAFDEEGLGLIPGFELSYINDTSEADIKTAYSQNLENLSFANASPLVSNFFKIKRPGNGFIRFASEKRKQLLEMYPNSDNREISKYLGAMWCQLSSEEKQPYNDLFYEEMADLKACFPEWNYAASRAKTSVKEQLLSEKVLSSRLRPRKKSRGIYEETSFKRPCSSNKKREPQNEGILWVQCDGCYKWRKLPPNTKQEHLPALWYCNMNEDPMFRECQIKQEN